MKTIMIEKGENSAEFIDRIVEMKKNSNDDFIVDFNNGIVLNTADYSGTDDFYHAILEAYGNEFGKLYNNTSLVEDEKENEETIVTSELANEENLTKGDNEVVNNIDSSDVENFYDSIFEPYRMESENLNKNSSMIENEEEVVEGSLDGIDYSTTEKLYEPIFDAFRNENKNLVNNSTIIENVDVNEISPLALESLEILTRYVIANNDFEKISLDYNAKYNSERLEKGREEYQKLVTVKKQEYDEIKKNIQSIIKKAYKDNISENQEIDNKIQSLISKKDEYNKVLEEYNYEKAQLEERLKKFEEVLNNSEGISSIVEKVNSVSLSDSKNFKVSDLIRYIPLTDDLVLKEELEKIHKLKWNVEAYEEYIEFFYNENYLKEIDEKIQVLENSKKTNDDLVKLSNDLIIEMHPGAKMDEDGKVVYDLEQDHPELIEARCLLDALDDMIKKGPDNPKVISDEILKMMYERKSSEEIEPLLNRLTSYINNSTINESFSGEKGLIEDIEKQISNVSSELESKKAKLLEKTPLNETLINIDTERLNRLVLASKKIDNMLEQCDIALSRKNIEDKITKIDKNIEEYNNFEIKNINEKNRYIVLNGENEDDIELQRLNQNLEFCNNTLALLKSAKSELKHDLKKMDVDELIDEKSAALKKETLLAKKEKNDKAIEELKAEINKKRDNGEYIDVIAKNEMESEIQKLEEKLSDLNKVRSSLGNHTIEELKDNILNYNKIKDNEEIQENLASEEDIQENLPSIEDNLIEEEIEENLKPEEAEEEFEENLTEDDLEEIEEIKPAKKSLIEKIKSLSFKKIAAAAVVAIVTLAAAITGGFGNNKKEHEEIKDTGVKLEQVIEETKDTGIDKMEQVAEAEKDRIEEQKQEEVVVEEKNEIDLSRIADNSIDAANENFIDEDRIYKPSFDVDKIDKIIEKQANGENVYLIVGEDGVPIGYTDVVDEELLSEKTR